MATVAFQAPLVFEVGFGSFVITWLILTATADLILAGESMIACRCCYNGDGSFQPADVRGGVPAPAGPAWGRRASLPPLATGDFNGDGITDVAVANLRTNDVLVALGNGDGTFQPQVLYGVGLSGASLVAADFNGDGRSDLATASSASDDVPVLLGNADGSSIDA